MKVLARALLALGRIESDVGDDEVARHLLAQALSSFEAGGDLGGQAAGKSRHAPQCAAPDAAAPGGAPARTTPTDTKLGTSQ